MRAMIQTVRRLPYVGLGWLGLALLLAAGFGLIQARAPGFWGQLTWQVSTGSLLLVLILYQWVLFAKRLLRRTSHMREHFLAHRWVGVATTFVFAAHAVRFGHWWMSGLAITFFLVALTGVLNREVLGYRQNWLYLLWLTCHVALSAMMVPLIAVHIWVALAYEGLR